MFPHLVVDPTAPTPESHQTPTALNAALYWRFLYEQCGGMQDGREDPSAGMAVVRRTLSTLYSKEVVDIASSTDLLVGLPRIMDGTLAKSSSCPFRTFEESLIHFSRAIYALTLGSGRCTEPGLPLGCGLYDPNGLYAYPPVRTLTYDGADHPQSWGVLRRSFGMVFINVELDAATSGQPLTLEIEGALGADAELSVQVWKLVGKGPDARPRPVAEQTPGPEVLGTLRGEGRLTYTVPVIDLAEFDRLALIITRVDAAEHSDPIGEYTIRLRPGGGV